MMQELSLRINVEETFKSFNEFESFLIDSVREQVSGQR